MGLRITLERTKKLLKGGAGILGASEFEDLLLDLQDHIVADNKKDSETENAQAAVVEYMKSAAEANKKHGSVIRASAEVKRDLFVAESYIESLRRRMVAAVGAEKTIRDWHEEFESSVHKCIAREKLGPVASMNPTLLRLQEALESTIHEAPPAK